MNIDEQKRREKVFERYIDSLAGLCKVRQQMEITIAEARYDAHMPADVEASVEALKSSRSVTDAQIALGIARLRSFGFFADVYGGKLVVINFDDVYDAI